MATLHGILAELGIENPFMHPEREIPHEADWTTGANFSPEEGKSYEVVLAQAQPGEQYKHVLKRIRADGPTPGDWFDLDDQEMLDRELQASTVNAFRPLTSAPPEGTRGKPQ